MDRISFEVLGTLRVRTASGEDVTPRGPLQRRLLATLVLERGRTVSVDRLTEALWPERPPAQVGASLQSHVFRIRKNLPALRIEHRPPGYVLRADDDDVDAHRFERAVSEAAALRRDDAEAALAVLDRALGWWRGEPYDDLVDLEAGRIEADRLRELQVRGAEERFAALVQLGRAPAALADLEAFAARHVLRERPRELLMEALAATGRRADALRVYDEYRRALADELGVEPSGHLRARHQHLLEEDSRPAAPPIRSRQATSTRLPRPVSSFVGREDLLTALEAHVDEHRMVTLVGPGGVGKTRLVLELLHRIGEESTDAVRFCELAATGPDDVVAVVAGAVGVEPRTGVDPLVRLSEVLRHERSLVVLDNCEHVLDATAPLVEHLLATTDDLVVVATSRERLAVDGEHVVTVDPLPAGGGTSPAVELFIDRAGAADDGFVADDAVRAVVADLCGRLDGLPLAVELAAARLRSLSLPEVVTGIERSSVAVLRGGRRTVPRHRSLQAALDWSYRLLSADEQAVLRAAAAFAGTFDAADVAAVAGRPLVEVEERLADLVERSLVLRMGRWMRLLRVVRAFLDERPDPAGRPALAHRHAHRIATRTEEASVALRTALDDGPVREVERLAADLRQAMATSLAAEDADLAIRIVLAVRDPAMNAMLPGASWGDDAGRLGEAAGHPLTADALSVAALAAWKAGDLPAMRGLLDRARAALEIAGGPERYEYLGALGIEGLALGELDRAVGILRRSLQRAEALDDLARLGEGGATLAITASYNHDPGACEEAERLLRDVAPRAGVIPAAWCWYAVGECLVEVDPDRSRSHLLRSLELARAGGATFTQGVAGASLASLDVRGGHLADAVDRYRWLLPLWLRAGVRAPMRTMLRTVAELLCRQGLDEPAARLLGAVTAPDAGHEVVGDDGVRLTAVRTELERRLGAARFAEALAEGRELDDAAAAEVATAAFELLF